MLVTSAVVGAGGSVRAGAGMAELAVRRTPSLLLVGARATLAGGTQGATAQAEFRDGLLMLLDDAAAITSFQARRARVQLGLRTSPPPHPSATAPQSTEANGDPRRRHRVKA